MYKFRTMFMEEGSAREVWAAKDDPRITPVGRFLRVYRLDELPQLLNVLKGDMNIVGPRPEQPSIFQSLRASLDDYPERQKVLPGITGWAQINHHYDQSLDDVKRKLRLDLQYIRRRSAVEDLKIMARTMPVMIFRKGAL
jgi:lipopolysaccharide/colanic/teichoic acid biosynthesis glycosyltransferase